MTPITQLTWQRIERRPYASCQECLWDETDSAQNAVWAARKHTQRTQHNTTVETVTIDGYSDPAR